MKRTEIIHISKNPILNHYCHLSKNLYNQATYLIKQYLKDNKLLSYYDLNKLLKDSENYKELPTQSAQQILKIVRGIGRHILKQRKNITKIQINSILNQNHHLLNQKMVCLCWFSQTNNVK